MPSGDEKSPEGMDRLYARSWLVLSRRLSQPLLRGRFRRACNAPHPLKTASIDRFGRTGV